MTKNNSSPIKSYENKDGKTLYKFQVYLGVDELTGKARSTTRRGFKTKKEAELVLARIKLQVSEGTYKQKVQRHIRKYTIFGSHNTKEL